MRNRCRNLILDFTHVYEDETVRDREQFQWIDCSDIAESHLYCSPSAYEEIRKRIEPFVLVCFDHHTDMQKPMVEGMTSSSPFRKRNYKTARPRRRWRR